MSWTLPYTIAYSDYYQKFMAVGAIVASSYPMFQFYHIVKAGHTAAVSWATWAILFVSNVFWIMYGLMVQDLVVFASSILPAVGGLAIIIAFCFLPHHPRRQRGFRAMR